MARLSKENCIVVCVALLVACGGSKTQLPGAPTNVTAEAGDAKVSLRWSPPADTGGNALSGYLVLGFPGALSIPVEGGATATTIAGLTNGTAYTFTVATRSGDGLGAASAPSDPVIPRGAGQKTLPGVPVAPTAVAGDAKAQVSWSAPDDGGSPILRYVVRTTPGNVAITVDALTLTVAVAPLANGTTYTFTVSAVNEIGEGAPSKPSAAVTPMLVKTVPGAPRSVRAASGNAHAYVGWEPPASDGNSVIQKYAVTATPGGAKLIVDASNARATFTNLTNGTPYTFTIVATNELGDGAASEPSNAVTPSAGGGPASWVSGYYVGYQMDLYAPDEVDFSALTHIHVGRIRPNADGTVVANFDINDTDGPAMAKKLSQRAHAAGKKAVLMLGGEGEHDGFVGAAADTTRATFVQNLLQTMDTLGYDGLDMDWEPINEEDKPHLMQLLKDLRAARSNIVLTMPVGWVNTNFPDDVDDWYADVALQVDQLNIMSYDMASSYWGSDWESWHFAALFDEGPHHPSSISGSVDAYLAKGIPASKLGIGIGFYGSCWRGVTVPRQMQGPGVSMGNGDNFMSYAIIMSKYFDASAYHWDDAAKQGYLSFAQPHGPQNCNFISYEDEASIAAKGQYVRSQGLGGTIIWTIGQGHVATAPSGQRDPLLAAVRAAFLE